MFQPSLIKREIAHHGPLASKDVNDSFDEVGHDLAAIATVLNTKEVSTQALLRAIANELLFLRQSSKQAQEELSFRVDQELRNDRQTTYFNSFRRINDITFESGAASVGLNRRCRLDTNFGQVTLPINDTLPVFFSPGGVEEDPIQAPNLNVQVLDQSVEAGFVLEGSPGLAFNGRPQDSWIRKVTYPLESDVTAVTVDVTVQVPRLFTKNVNTFNVKTLPTGMVDILEAKYSPTSATPNLDIPNFTAMNNVSELRTIFAAVEMVSMRVRLRQRNYTVENGKKVFYVGAQEIGLSLTEFDSTFSATPAVGDNNSFILVTRTPLLPGPAPVRPYYEDVIKLFSLPDFSHAPVVDATDNGIAIKLFSDVDLTNKIWDSLTDTNANVGSAFFTSNDIDTLYWLFELDIRFGGASPILENFGFEYKVKP